LQEQDFQRPGGLIWPGFAESSCCEAIIMAAAAATFEDRDAVDEILFALHDISQVLFVFFPLKAA